MADIKAGEHSETRFDSLWRMISEREIILPNGQKKRIILRSIGREDSKLRQEYAREQAGLAREKLMDKESEEYAKSLRWTEKATQEELEALIRKWFSSILKREAEEEVFLLSDPDDIPEGETLVDSLEREEEEARKQKEVEEAREQYVKANIEHRIAGVIEDRDKLETAARRILMEALCFEVHNLAWDDATLYYGVLNMDGSRFFGEIPKNADEGLVGLLHTMYRPLDEGSYRPSF